AGAQYRDPADERRDDHDRASHAAREQAPRAQDLARRDVPAGLHLPRVPGRGVRTRLPGSRIAARLGRHLRLDVLHADRFPRSARADRLDHAVRRVAARDARPFHAGAALRVRGRRLVLALRRRRLARPLRLRLLALIPWRPAGALAALRRAAALFSDGPALRTRAESGVRDAAARAAARAAR